MKSPSFTVQSYGSIPLFALLLLLCTGCAKAQVSLGELVPGDTLIAFSGAKNSVGFGWPPYGDAYIYNHRQRSFHRLTKTRVNVPHIELYQVAPQQVGAFVAAQLPEHERIREAGALRKLHRLLESGEMALIDKADVEGKNVYSANTVNMASLSVCEDGSGGVYLDKGFGIPNRVVTFTTDPFRKQEIGAVGLGGEVNLIDCNTVAVFGSRGTAENMLLILKQGQPTGQVRLSESAYFASMGESQGLLYILGNSGDQQYQLYTFDPETEGLSVACTFENTEPLRHIAAYGDTVFMATNKESGSDYIVSLQLSDCSVIDRVVFEGMVIQNLDALDVPQTLE